MNRKPLITGFDDPSKPRQQIHQGGLLPAERGEGALTIWNDRDHGAVIKVNAISDKNNGKYVLEITKEQGPSDEVNKAIQMAESAAKLLHHAEIFRGMGEQLLFQTFPPSLPSIFIKSAL